METETAPSDRRRKSLAIDQETYEMLRDICSKERRTLISQLQIMIEDLHQEMFYEDER